VSGELVTASLMNTYIRDDFAYLKDSPTFDGDVAVTGTLGVTGATTLAAVTATGQVVISGASAGQIVFPAAQNASTDANTLDDYDEGSWTPAIGGTGGQSGQVYATQVGRYVKIGKAVTAYFQITLSTLGTITSNAQIQGFPFTSENTAGLRAPLLVSFFGALTSNASVVGGFMEPNVTTALLYFVNAPSTSMSAMVQADFSATSQLIGSVTYRATT
jgi:hypothetical protein